MGTIFFVLATTLLLTGDTALAGSDASGDPCLGKWTGWAVNSGSDPWSIDMRVTAISGEACGVIEYPSLGCGGFLERCVKIDNQITFKERYTHNPGTCAPAGVVKATCKGDVMEWRWTGTERVRTKLKRAPTDPNNKKE